MADTTAFVTLRRLARECAGIELDAGKQAFVAARLDRRLRALGLSGLEDYARLVDGSDSPERQHFVDAITTNHTSFMREMEHFELLARLAERWAGDAARPIRVWCAAAASGEEAYSAAMVLDEVTERRGGSYHVWATDISVGALAKARRGKYGDHEIAPVPPLYRQRAFERVATGMGGEPRYAVRPRIREQVEFDRINLAGAPSVPRDTFDVIFCRNVLIYFGADTRQSLVTVLERSLRPGGVLMIGHAECLNGVQTELAHIRPSIFARDEV